MQSKISQLTAFAAVAAFAAGPVFALDAHLVPVPTGEVTTEAAPVEDVAGDVAAEASALPKIPWAELNGFPHPIPGAEEEGEEVEATGAEETSSAVTWSTWSPPLCLTEGPTHTLGRRATKATARAPEITSVAPVKPASHSVAPVAPVKTPVVVAGASKTQGFLLGVAVAALGLAVFGL
ncbi:hypothetical protein V8F33_010801 [Rhypophila sp. PSN 637]